MKLNFILFIAALMCLSIKGFSGNALEKTSHLSSAEIQLELDKKYSLRDSFKEKGNSGKYLKFHTGPN